jgi:SAM-dependent methyltransferase
MTVTGWAPVLAVFDDVLSRAHDGHPVRLAIRDDRGVDHPMDPRSWCRRHLPGDRRLLGRCSGPTLDVGCGPGRLTSALNRLGHPALGIDVSAAAVRLARIRGATAMRRDVFAPVPGHGRWRHLLLADGNIGIGGDPERLLRRCRELVARDGRIHLETARPGTRSWTGEVRFRESDGHPSAPFRWAVVAADDLATVASAGALRVVDSWTEAGRWFATLTPR